jgi:hypothetical protein
MYTVKMHMKRWHQQGPPCTQVGRLVFASTILLATTVSFHSLLSEPVKGIYTLRVEQAQPILPELVNYTTNALELNSTSSLQSSSLSTLPLPNAAAMMDIDSPYDLNTSTCLEWSSVSFDYIKRILPAVTTPPFDIIRTKDEIGALVTTVLGKRQGFYVDISSSMLVNSALDKEHSWNGVCIVSTIAEAASLKALGRRCTVVCNTDPDNVNNYLYAMLNQLLIVTPLAVDFISALGKNVDGCKALRNLDMGVYQAKVIAISRPSSECHLYLVDNGYLWLTTLGSEGNNFYVHSSTNEIVDVMNKYRTSRSTKWLGSNHRYLLKPDWNLPDSILKILEKTVSFDESGFTNKDRCEHWMWLYSVVPDLSWGRLPLEKKRRWYQISCSKIIQQ